jgi:hypothetical protein
MNDVSKGGRIRLSVARGLVAQNVREYRLGIFARFKGKEMDAAREGKQKIFLDDRADQLGDLFGATFGLY